MMILPCWLNNSNIPPKMFQVLGSKHFSWRLGTSFLALMRWGKLEPTLIGILSLDQAKVKQAYEILHFCKVKKSELPIKTGSRWIFCADDPFKIGKGCLQMTKVKYNFT